MEVTRKPWFSYTVTVEDEGMTVTGLLRQRFSFSRGILTRLRHERGVKLLVNGESAFTNENVRGGDVITLVFKEDEKLCKWPESRALSIVYEDFDVLIVDKPHGMLVHPVGEGMDNSLASSITCHLRKQGIPERLHLIQRLDQDTSGLIMVGKNPLSAFRLSQQMEAQRIKKSYLAVVDGRMEGSGLISAPIAHSPDHTTKRQVAMNGKPAQTRYRVLGCAGGKTVLVVRPVTGRTHQIRVHMAYAGHPVVGDTLYGNGGDSERMALHCYRLQFLHPGDGRVMNIRGPIPRNLERYKRSLHHDTALPGT